LGSFRCVGELRCVGIDAGPLWRHDAGQERVRGGLCWGGEPWLHRCYHSAIGATDAGAYDRAARRDDDGCPRSWRLSRRSTSAGRPAGDCGGRRLTLSTGDLNMLDTFSYVGCGGRGRRHGCGNWRIVDEGSKRPRASGRDQFACFIGRAGVAGGRSRRSVRRLGGREGLPARGSGGSGRAGGNGRRRSSFGPPRIRQRPPRLETPGRPLRGARQASSFWRRSC